VIVKRCVDTVIAGDLSLVASRLYRIAFTQPQSHVAVTLGLRLGCHGSVGFQVGLCPIIWSVPALLSSPLSVSLWFPASVSVSQWVLRSAWVFARIGAVFPHRVVGPPLTFSVHLSASKLRELKPPVQQPRCQLSFALSGPVLLQPPFL